MIEPIHVLIIDDDPADRFLTKYSLMDYSPDVSFSIVEAENGLDGIHTISKADRVPDVVLLDVNMPVMDGHQFLDSFAQLEHPLRHHPHIYVLSTVAHTVQDRTQKLVKGRFEKPLTDEHIKIILGSKKERDVQV